MGFRDFFTKKKEETAEHVTHLSLSDMQPGYFVDYDLKTWEVTARHRYDWGEGDITHEWQLTGVDEIICLEKETDDETYWSINRKIAFARLGSKVKDELVKNEGPPEQVVLDGVTYYLEESGAGHFFKDSKGEGRPMLCWDYEDEGGKRYLSIEQWGETDFEASAGEPVEEYQFSDILPGATPE